jgi:hypothetical protein
LERNHSASSALTGCPGVSSGPEAVEPVVEVMPGAVRNVAHPGIDQREARADSVPDWVVQRPPITGLIAGGVLWYQLTVVTGPPGSS